MESIKLDPLSIGRGHRFQTMIDSLPSKGSHRPILHSVSSYQQTSECNIYKIDNHVMVLEIVKIPLAFQVVQLFRYTPVTMVFNNTLIIPSTDKTFVAIDNKLSREIAEDELKHCTFVENTYVCNDISGTFHKPDNSDCILKIALN